MMKFAVAVAFVVSMAAGAVSAREQAAPTQAGESCVDDSYCNYGEICIKSSSEQPMGRCVKGVR